MKQSFEIEKVFVILIIEQKKPARNFVVYHKENVSSFKE